MFPPDGRCHMRLDDTNPSKEDQEYVDSILEDVRWVQSSISSSSSTSSSTSSNINNVNDPWFGPVRKTSDYFETIYKSAIHLIQSGNAYVESCTAEEMKRNRGSLKQAGVNSPFRNRSVDENIKIFEEMQSGQHPNGAHVLRAKIDMSSANLNLRDPTLYRIMHSPPSHPSTGDDWCIYPMYDFSHPIADAIEGITHSLCMLEFMDLRPLYDWVLDRLWDTGILDVGMVIIDDDNNDDGNDNSDGRGTHSPLRLRPRPRQIEFSRLNIKHTILSKRKLIKLVESKIVDGWDDPRMPTVSGLRRRGVPAKALRKFCERAGISKVDSRLDPSDLGDCIRDVMDQDCTRAFAVLEPLKVTLTNWDGSTLENFEIPRHPKRQEMGERTVPFGKRLYIEQSDFFDLNGPQGLRNKSRPPKGFKRLLEGGFVRLKNAYAVRCDSVVRFNDDEEGAPVELLCSLVEGTRAGSTPEGMGKVKGIIQWVEARTAVRCTVRSYDRLFLPEDPAGDETRDGNGTKDAFLEDINPDSLKVLEGAVVEPSVAIDCMQLMAEIQSNNCSDGDGCRVYHSQAGYQFERNGYFALDSSASDRSLVFNRVVTLRDTWKGGKAGRDKSSKGESDTTVVGTGDGARQQRRRGGPVPAVVEDLRRVAFRVGTILESGPHPEADNLLVCTVDCGDVNEDDGQNQSRPRTVVAGLAGKVQIDGLVGRRVACVTNLKPARMRGIESTAMFLAASSGESVSEIVELLDIPVSVPNGELLSFDGKDTSEPDSMMKSKGAVKAFERVKSCLRTNGDGEAIYVMDGKEYRLMSSGGPVTVATLKGCDIG